jgi:adenylate cyclase
MTWRSGRLFYLSLVCILLGGALLLRYADPFFVRALRLIAFDYYQRISPADYDPKLPIRIVDIDERSLAKIGQWPWPRTTVRDLLLELTSKGAAAVAFDVIFAEPDRTSVETIIKQLPEEVASAIKTALADRPSNDELFAAALKETPSVLSVALGEGSSTSFQAKAGFAIAGDDPAPFLQQFVGASRNLASLDDAARGIGAFNWVADRDQIVRRVALLFRLNQTLVPSLAAETLRVAQGASTYLLKASNASGETAYGSSTGLNHIRIGDVEVPTDAGGGVYLKFRHFTNAAYIPAWKVLAGEVPQEEIDGRIIMIGTSAPGLLDLRATPIDAAVPGIDIQAQIVEHLLTGKFLKRPDYSLALEQTIILLLGLMLAITLPRVSAYGAAVIGFATIAVIMLGGWATFRYADQLFDSSYPALVMASMTGIITFYTYHTAEVQRSQIRHAFGQYLAPALVEQLAQSPEKLVLGGEEREMTIMFSDVRGFTSISESYKKDPQGLTALMNRFLTPITNAIIERKGTIDKYMGDAVMAFWNAPIDDATHELNACEAALDMLDRVDTLNRAREQEAKTKDLHFIPINIGIGINTGHCVVGNMGSDLRFDYSVLGDSVNLASRLEGQCKSYGLPIIIGSKTAEAVKDRFAILELDFIAVKGKNEPEVVYAIVGRDDLAKSEQFQRWRELNINMLSHYRSRNWAAALADIEQGLKADEEKRFEKLYHVYEERIRAFQVNPPPDDWVGAYALDTK